MPILFKLLTMLSRPLFDQSLGRSRPEIALLQAAVKVKNSSLPLILGVEMWGRMIVIEHPYDNTKKHR
jgi:hypothetical protein